MEVVPAGFSTAGLDVRGGFITDTGVKLQEITEGREATGTRRSCIRLSFAGDFSILWDPLALSCWIVSSDIACSDRNASSLASSTWSLAAATTLSASSLVSSSLCCRSNCVRLISISTLFTSNLTALLFLSSACCCINTAFAARTLASWVFEPDTLNLEA